MENFHERLKKLRLENGWTQQELADKLSNIESNGIKLKKQTISSYENGIEPSISMLNNIAKIFNVTVDYLVGNDNYKDKSEKSLADILSKKLSISPELVSKIMPLMNPYIDILKLSIYPNSKEILKEFEDAMVWLRDYIMQSLEDINIQHNLEDALAANDKDQIKLFEEQISKSRNKNYYFIRFSRSLNNYINILQNYSRNRLENDYQDK